MSAVEIQRAIEQMTSEERSKLAAWLDELVAEEWDRQIERDAGAGKFDAMNQRAKEDFEAGRCTPL